MNKITIELTEDQIFSINTLIDEELGRAYTYAGQIGEAPPVQYTAFLRRIKTILAKAKS